MAFHTCGSIRLVASRVASAAIGSTILLSLCEKLSSTNNNEGKELQNDVTIWNSLHQHAAFSFTTTALCASGDEKDEKDNASNEHESYLESHLGHSAYQEVASLNKLQQNAPRQQPQTTPSLMTTASREPQAKDGGSYLETNLGTEAYKEVMALNALQTPRQQVPSPSPEQDTSSADQVDASTLSE